MQMGIVHGVGRVQQMKRMRMGTPGRTVGTYTSWQERTATSPMAGIVHFQLPYRQPAAALRFSGCTVQCTTTSTACMRLAALLYSAEAGGCVLLKYQWLPGGALPGPHY